MGHNLCHHSEALRNWDNYEVDDDFGSYLTAVKFVTVASNSGTVAVTDAVNGVIQINPSDGTVTDNDETYVKGAGENFKFGADQILFRARVKFTEGSTDDANIAVGLCDAVAADTILDNGGGMKASFSGMVMYKVDGETVWRCITSIGSTRTVTVSTTTAGGAWQTLEMEYLKESSTVGYVTFKIDGEQLVDSAGTKIRHSITYASATEMQTLLGIKNGADTTVEALLVDRLTCVTRRA